MIYILFAVKVGTLPALLRVILARLPARKALMMKRSDLVQFDCYDSLGFCANHDESEFYVYDGEALVFTSDSSSEAESFFDGLAWPQYKKEV